MGSRVSPRLPPVMKDNLFSLADGLRRGRPPPSSKNLCEGPLIDEEPAAEAAPIIDPTSISRCCIEGGLFPAVPVFFQYPCGITGGWSEWVEHELEDPINRDTLRKAAVLDAIFVSERCEIHLEVQLLRHVIRRWSSETHTFICSWGEFTPTLEDVVNILHLPIVGNQDPFNIILDAKDKERLEILKKGAMSRQSLRFSSWVKHFGDKDEGHSCSLHALVSLWLGKFVFCDFSSDYMHERVFPLALAIGRGDVIPLAPMFLGYLYRLLDQVHLLEKGAAGTMAVESFLNSSFLQVFLWEHINGLDVCPLPCSQAGLLVRASDVSYTPNMPPLISRWFRRKQRKGQNFLELLDDIQHFVFRPYTKVPRGFGQVSFYAEVGGTSIIIPRGEQSRKDAYLNMAGLPLFTFGDDHSETSIHYSTHRVRRQFGLDQGVPVRPDFCHPLEMHKVFWSRVRVPDDGRQFALALTSRERVGGCSKGHRVYWNRCFAYFTRFHASSPRRLLPSIDHHRRLISEKKAIALSEKRNLAFTSKDGKIVGRFLESVKRSTVLQKSIAKQGVSEKRSSQRKKKFKPKVAVIGPPMKKLSPSIGPKQAMAPTASVPSVSLRKRKRRGSHLGDISTSSTSELDGEDDEADFAYMERSEESISDIPADHACDRGDEGEVGDGGLADLDHPLEEPLCLDAPLEFVHDATTSTPHNVDNLIDMSGYDPSCYELEDAFSAFMVFFDSDTRILRSSDELLPLCYEFQGYETFRGAQVFPETVKSLSKFFDSYEARIESARNLSFSSKNLAFRGLGLSLYGMDVTSYSEISDHKLLCWRDTIRDAISYGLQVGFLLDILKMRLARAVFETRAACGAAISTQFLKVGATTQALKLKHQELDSECHKLRELLLEKGISSNNAGYVLEAAKGSPCNASSILYDTH
ncbi:uncharacterized protein LOC110767396 isoform X2 [Prunus avium]|uniref:Uncharacterized protein LOC110767396 isoform X2 n=1 Tax=Prunus avium TaxID=42229 RepID=A0A6P5THC1_PRUAV|nr:uncharacterized protein LOC110767396 isoform X2 [Prunus avium]